jgi:hypothetical protein
MASFTLSKTVRDNAEAHKLIEKLSPKSPESEIPML